MEALSDPDAALLSLSGSDISIGLVFSSYVFASFLTSLGRSGKIRASDVKTEIKKQLHQSLVENDYKKLEKDAVVYEQIPQIYVQNLQLCLCMKKNKVRNGTDPWPTPWCLDIFPTPQGRPGTWFFSSVQ